MSPSHPFSYPVAKVRAHPGVLLVHLLADKEHGPVCSACMGLRISDGGGHTACPKAGCGAYYAWGDGHAADAQAHQIFSMHLMQSFVRGAACLRSASAVPLVSSPLEQRLAAGHGPWCLPCLESYFDDADDGVMSCPAKRCDTPYLWDGSLMPVVAVLCGICSRPMRQAVAYTMECGTASAFAGRLGWSES